MIYKRKSGFILVLTMILLAATVLLVSLVVNRVVAYRSLSKLWSDREKARFIALGGIHIAMSQLGQLEFLTKSSSSLPKLSSGQSEQAENEEQKKKEETQRQVEAVQTLLNLGTWQDLTFTTQKEGFDAMCSLYMAAEEGKIPIAGLYDSNNKKWVQRGSYDAKKLLVILDERLKSVWRGPFVTLTQPLEEFYKKEGVVLEDLSQLLKNNKQLGMLQDNFFVTKDMNKPAFSDVFTVTSGSSSINPLLFSKGVLAVLGIKKKTVKELETIPVAEITKLAQSSSIDWQQIWPTILKPLYGKDYKAFPAEITALFSSQFEANVFSVVSYGKVGMATQKIAAFIEKNKQTAHSSSPFIIRKLYWL